MHFKVNWNENGKTQEGELMDIHQVEGTEVYEVRPFGQEEHVSMKRHRDDLKLTPVRNIAAL